MHAAIDADPQTAQGAICIAIGAKTACAKRADRPTTGLAKEITPQGYQDGLLFEGVIGEKRALFRGAGEEKGVNLVGPFGMQVQLHVVTARTDQIHDRRQMLDAKAGREEWLDEKYPRQPIAAEYLERLGKGEIAFSRSAEYVSLEAGSKVIVEIIPAVAPDFYIEGQEDPHGQSSDPRVSENAWHALRVAKRKLGPIAKGILVNDEMGFCFVQE